MQVNICGISHTVEEKEDIFNANELHFGQIDFKKCEIYLSKESTSEVKKEALCHEMVHGILVHLGYNELSNDETFVQAFGNAIAQGFNPILKESEE